MAMDNSNGIGEADRLPAAGDRLPATHDARRRLSGGTTGVPEFYPP
jgi:hypothetical protein